VFKIEESAIYQNPVKRESKGMSGVCSSEGTLAAGTVNLLISILLNHSWPDTFRDIDRNRRISESLQNDVIYGRIKRSGFGSIQMQCGPSP